jgi:hypothetical protein
MEPKVKVPKHPPAKMFAVPRDPKAQRIFKGRMEKRKKELTELQVGLTLLNTRINSFRMQHGIDNPKLLTRKHQITDRMKKTRLSMNWWRTRYEEGL